ncbi:MAG: hypothetical protein JWO85_523 [Candidatus Eremiobacteraeota bacterium]|nr:hypothetical protein [Candidatus Eremiobacteraeota bacterium]
MPEVVNGKIMLGLEAVPLVDALIAVNARNEARKREREKREREQRDDAALTATSLRSG